MPVRKLARCKEHSRNDKPIAIGNTISVGQRFPTLDRLLVGLDVEIDEQAQVARKQCATEESSIFGTRTVANVGKIRSVSSSKVLET